MGTQCKQLHGSQFFASNGTFTVPPRVTAVSALLVGGGMGNNYYLSGAGGYVTCGTVNVQNGDTISVVIGVAPIGAGGGPAPPQFFLI